MTSIKKRLTQRAIKMYEAERPALESQQLAQDILNEVLQIEKENKELRGKPISRLTEYARLNNIKDSRKLQVIEPTRQIFLEEYQKAMESNSDKEATKHVAAMMKALKIIKNDKDYWGARARLRFLAKNEKS